MAVVFLVRHAVHDLIDTTLVGRTPGVGLGHEGLAQADRLGEYFARQRITAIESSPQLRAQQTAERIAARLPLPVNVNEAFDEIELGAWTGRSFDDLADDPMWRDWNEHRGSACPPGGETMAALQQRAVSYLAALADDNRNVVIVSHAEPIRAVIMHYRDIALDHFMRIAVLPASITTLVIEHEGGRVIDHNRQCEAAVAA